MKNFISFLALTLITLFLSSNHASAENRLTPFERIVQQRDTIEIDVADTDANELIPRILARTGLQFTFIKSQEERLLSIKTKAKAMHALETVVFAAGFNIHKDGNYWVIHPLPIEETNVID